MPKLYSGGAEGSDLIFGEMAKILRHDVVHFIFQGHNCKEEDVIVLSKSQLKVADPYLIDANKILLRKFPTSSNYVNSLLRRNYYQILNSDSLYAICDLDSSNSKPSGGTAWAIIMFIQNRTGPVYILSKGEWYQFNRDKNIYELMSNFPPCPDGNWTGIGTRTPSKISLDKLIKWWDFIL